MDGESLEEKIREIILPVIEYEGFELFDIKFLKGGKNSYLRIFIDKERGGVTLDDCQNISTQIGAILDVEDPIDRHYILEVSSPGLDRPLKKGGDFIRFKNRMIKLSTFEPLTGKKSFTGKIIDFKDNVLLLDVNKKGIINIPYNQIKNARLEVDF